MSAWWRRLRAWFWRQVDLALLPALERETATDRSVGYRESASQLELRVASVESIIASYEEEARALDQRALEALDRYSADLARKNTALYDAATQRRLSQEKRELIADLRKRAGLA